MKTKTQSKTSNRSLVGSYVLVGTDRNMLMAGVLVEHDSVAKSATLMDARQICYWPEGVKGACGVAALGPSPKARVTPAVEYAVVYGVTGLLVVSAVSRAAIEAAPWG